MAYSAYYTHEEADDVPRSRFGLIKRSLRNGYLNSRYSAHLQPTSRIGRWVTPLLPKRRRIDEDIRHLPTTGKPGVLVDIGCGNGQYLVTAMQLGWETWGIDLDPKAVEAAKKTGAIVSQGGFPDTGLPSGHFDIVTLSHVIEHVFDPIGALKEVFRILKPGGKIWIATPNLESFGHARFRSNWRGLEPPRHLVLFNHNSLGKALVYSGFINIQQKHCWGHASWFFQSSMRISHGQDPNDACASVLPIILRIASNFADWRAAVATSRCEVIVMMAKRPESI
jgi:2-polyprenyl-3-methyl-5-hydroxy-6-metoxy-1,4-benzoquinol methylase